MKRTKMVKNKVNFVSGFPDELVLEIFQYLPPKKRGIASLVSKEWNRLAWDYIYWKKRIEEEFNLSPIDFFYNFNKNYRKLYYTIENYPYSRLMLSIAVAIIKTFFELETTPLIKEHCNTLLNIILKTITPKFACATNLFWYILMYFERDHSKLNLYLNNISNKYFILQDKLKRFLISNDTNSDVLPLETITPYLCLRDARLNLESIKKLLSLITQKKIPISLDISENNIENYCLQLIIDSIMSKQCQFTTINLRNNNVTDAGITNLATALKTENKISILDLSLNNITNIGVSSLAEAIKSAHCKLKLLYLEYCHFDVEGARALANAVVYAKYNHTRITHISLIQKFNFAHLLYEAEKSYRQLEITAGKRKRETDLDSRKNPRLR